MNSTPPSQASLVYEAIDVKKEYDDGNVQALRGVTFSVFNGEFIAITGPSGCGKSTLLQMLGTLDIPSSGILNYRGSSLPDMADHSEYRACEIGFVFQSFHLLPTFTALENVQMPMFGHLKSPSARQEKATELLKLVGLEHRMHHYPSKMSGGERQRVAIARSLANGPSVLLADEPTGNLDSANASNVLDLLVKLHKERHMTLVMVTHDLGIAELASRTIQMRDGHIVCDGSSAAASTSQLASS